MAGRRLDPRLPQLRDEAVTALKDGRQEFALNVANLPRRERNMVRNRIHRWARANGWVTRVHYDPDAETLDVRVAGRREPAVRGCHPSLVVVDEARDFAD